MIDRYLVYGLFLFRNWWDQYVKDLTTEILEDICHQVCFLSPSLSLTLINTFFSPLLTMYLYYLISLSISLFLFFYFLIISFYPYLYVYKEYLSLILITITFSIRC